MTPLFKTVLMVDHRICFYGEIWLIIPKLSLFLLIWSSGTVNKKNAKKLKSLDQDVFGDNSEANYSPLKYNF